MPKLKTEQFGSGDQSWLGSAHGIHECRTEILDISAFTAATHFPDGYIKSGYPVAKVAGLLVPYNSAGTGGIDVLAGFVFTDQPVVGTQDFPVPLLDHGRVKPSKVPQAAFAAPVAAKNATTIVFNG